MSDRPPLLRPYVRQSLGRLGETRDTSLSLDAQAAVIEDWAAANGFTVAQPIRDHDLKGDDPNRPGLLDLEQQAMPGDTVAVYKFDRLARDVVLQESLVRRLQARDVQVISVTEPSTRLTRVIYGAVNEEFRDALSQRIRDAKRQQALRGQYMGAGTPYGYRRSNVQAIPLPDGSEYLRPTGVLTIDPAEAAIVGEIYERIAGGESTYAIARDLNRRGVPTRRNLTWTVTGIRRLVANRWYYGAVTYKGDVIATGVHTPLIAADLWERANTLLQRPTMRQKPRTVSSWLEGYVRHSCGRRMYLMRTGTRVQFACQSAYDVTTCGQPRRHVSLRRLDPSVRACLTVDLSALVPVADALDHAVAVAGGVETVERRAALDGHRARVLARYERVRDAWAAGMESLDWLAAEQAKRDTALADIDAQLAQLPATPDPDRYQRIGAQLASVAGVLAEMDDAALTTVLAELGVVLVDRTGVRIQYDDALAHFVSAPHVVALG